MRISPIRIFIINNYAYFAYTHILQLHIQLYSYIVAVAATAATTAIAPTTATAVAAAYALAARSISRDTSITAESAGSGFNND